MPGDHKTCRNMTYVNKPEKQTKRGRKHVGTTQNEGRCEFVLPSVPRLPRKTPVDVSLCYACHAKRGRCECVPRLPRQMPVDVSMCRACSMSQILQASQGRSLRAWPLSVPVIKLTRSQATGTRHATLQLRNLEESPRTNAAFCSTGSTR